VGQRACSSLVGTTPRRLVSPGSDPCILIHPDSRFDCFPSVNVRQNQVDIYSRLPDQNSLCGLFRESWSRSNARQLRSPPQVGFWGSLIQLCYHALPVPSLWGWQVLTTSTACNRRSKRFHGWALLQQGHALGFGEASGLQPIEIDPSCHGPPGFIPPNPNRLVAPRLYQIFIDYRLHQPS